MRQAQVDISPDDKHHGECLPFGSRRCMLSVRVASAGLLLVALLLLGSVVTIAEASAPERQAFLEKDVQALLDRRFERIEPFVNWTYGWASSYANSYIVAAKVVASVLKSRGNWFEVAATTMSEQQLRALRERVTRPDDDAAAISSLIDRHVRSRIFSDRAKLLGADCGVELAAACTSQRGKDIDAAATAVLGERTSPASVAKEHRDIAALLSSHSEANVSVAHTLRPLLSRIVIFILRLTELTSLIVLITSGLRRIYLPNTPVVRIAVTLALAWGLDYAVLRTERAINESDFERRIVSQIQEQNRSVTEYVTARVEATEAEFTRRAGASSTELQQWQ